MRYALIVTTLLFLLAPPSFAQQDNFPYTAIVLNDQTKVYSGPGDTHYATHSLKENQLVEVYRHDPGGWCAIRPPEKSFSLIPETAAKRLSGQIAEILVDGSQAWVGTALGAVENPLWQVKLKKGERVAVVGEASWPHSSGKSIVWLQIEPPAGEYRWVRLADLQLPPAQDNITRASPADYSQPPALASTNNRNSAPPRRKPRSADAEPTFTSITSTHSSSGWKAATRPIPKTEPARVEYSGTFRRTKNTTSQIPVRGFGDDSLDSKIEQASFLDDRPADPRFEAWDGAAIPPLNREQPPVRPASRDLSDRVPRSLVREQPMNATPPNSVRARSATNAFVSQNSELIGIEDQLSKEMLKEPQAWNLADLKFQTERAKARSEDPVERLALQHVLEKIARCDGLQKNYLQASPFATASARQPVTKLGSSGSYDATGWLKRLASSSGSVDPAYVLQDSLGNVTHEIAGAAGANLGGYVDKQVGVIGRRGFNRRLNLKHVTAERVVVLRR